MIFSNSNVAHQRANVRQKHKYSDFQENRPVAAERKITETAKARAERSRAKSKQGEIMKKKNIKRANVKAPLTVKRKYDGKEVNERVYTNTPHGFKSSEKAAPKKTDKPATKTKTPAPKRTVAKASQKSTGKSPSASKNSVKTAVATKTKTFAPDIPKKSEQTTEKRRVYKSLPKGYSVVQGTVAQIDGTILIHNGKPLFKQNKDGTTQQAKDRRGRPAHKTAALVVDPKAFNEAKTAERKLVDVEIRKHNDAKGGHPHIMVDTVGDKNVSVGITHSKKKGKNHPNLPLEVNPLGGTEQTFLRRQGTVDNKENYGATAQTGKMTVTDNAKAKQIGERAKQKELNKQTPKT